jgi:hypothetical protein
LTEKKIKRYFGKPILATDPNFSISSGFLAENFAAGIHQQKNASGIAIIIYIHGGMAQSVKRLTIGAVRMTGNSQAAISCRNLFA